MMAKSPCVSIWLGEQLPVAGAVGPRIRRKLRGGVPVALSNGESRSSRSFASSRLPSCCWGWSCCMNSAWPRALAVRSLGCGLLLLAACGVKAKGMGPGGMLAGDPFQMTYALTTALRRRPCSQALGIKSELGVGQPRTEHTRQLCGVGCSTVVWHGAGARRTQSAFIMEVRRKLGDGL